MKKPTLSMIAAAIIAAVFFACSKENNKLNKRGSDIKEPDLIILPKIIDICN